MSDGQIHFEVFARRNQNASLVLEMATEDRAPLMKLTVSKDGTTMGLSDDSQPGGIELRANREKGTYVKVVSRDGKEQTLKP